MASTSGAVLAWQPRVPCCRRQASSMSCRSAAWVTCRPVAGGGQGQGRRRAGQEAGRAGGGQRQQYMSRVRQ